MGAPTPEGAPTYYLAKFSQKLHENEILAQKGTQGTRAPSFDPPLEIEVHIKIQSYE